jgi:UDP-3-O-acyl-N-acetylglucosamine deacetylase
MTIAEFCRASIDVPHRHEEPPSNRATQFATRSASARTTFLLCLTISLLQSTGLSKRSTIDMATGVSGDLKVLKSDQILLGINRPRR